jgi:hypothetical protein
MRGSRSVGITGLGRPGGDRRSGVSGPAVEQDFVARAAALVTA